MKNIKVSERNWEKIMFLRISSKAKNIDQVISSLIKKFKEKK